MFETHLAPYIREVVAAFTGDYDVVDSIVANDEVNECL